ncbi:MAG: long-chain fatty acid--CoA ligase [Desulfarculus sp.]|jgi:long-chain acyl-CoA synthetase|nr:MAG: long-chain fatty acid--CoA ligase [Desulfarculus sp.]
MNLVSFLKERADKFGDKVFLDGPEGRLSYRAFDQASDRLAQGLQQLGVQPGQRVAMLHPNSQQTFLAYYAIIKTGAATVPINSVYTPREIAYILNNSQASLLITREDFRDRVEGLRGGAPHLKQVIVRDGGEPLEQALARAVGGPLGRPIRPDFNPEQAAIIFYTSGTTGNPKGVIVSHRNFCFGGPNIAQNFGLRADDVALAVLPMVHVFCVASPFFGSLSCGARAVVVEGFSPERVLEAIAQYRVTWFPGVPTMFNYLLSASDKSRHDVSSLRMGLSGGASLPVEVLKQWEARFGAEIVEAYGLTESTGLVTCTPLYGQRKPGSIGIAVSGVAARLVDKRDREVPPGQVGHLIFRGPNATQGYYNLPQETQHRIRDGWLYTGDHAYRDEDGYFFIVGREQELIITGGYNVYPREIEEVIHACPGVNEVAVVGVPHPGKGEVPKAFVALKPGAQLSQDDLLDHCRAHLAPYKMPRVEFVAELPKSPTGKILKKELPRA